MSVSKFEIAWVSMVLLHSVNEDFKRSCIDDEQDNYEDFKGCCEALSMGAWTQIFQSRPSQQEATTKAIDILRRITASVESGALLESAHQAGLHLVRANDLDRKIEN